MTFVYVYVRVITFAPFTRFVAPDCFAFGMVCTNLTVSHVCTTYHRWLKGPDERTHAKRKRETTRLSSVAFDALVTSKEDEIPEKRREETTAGMLGAKITCTYVTPHAPISKHETACSKPQVPILGKHRRWTRCNTNHGKNTKHIPRVYRITHAQRTFLLQQGKS